MTSRTTAKTRALAKAFARHWDRVRADPRLLPHVVGKAWRIVRHGRLDALVERNRLRTQWFDDYGAWLAEHHRETPLARDLLRDRVAALAAAPRLAVVVLAGEATPAEDVAASLAAIDAQYVPAAAHFVLSPHTGARRALPPAVVDYAPDEGPWRALAALLPHADADWIGVLDAGDRLAHDALGELALELAAAPQAALVYTDHDQLDARHARTRPDLKPCWDPYLFAQQNYIGRAWFARRDALADALAALPAPRSEWDLLWRIAEAVPAGAIGHLPRLLVHLGARRPPRPAGPRPPHAHFERAGIAAAFEPCAPGAWRMRLPPPSPAPRVSVIIPTRDHPALLAAAAKSVLEGTDYPDVELVVVDNGSVEAATLALLDRLRSTPRVRVLRDDGAFNFARLNNRAVREATGAVLCFLNDDTEAIARDWLPEMVGLALQPDTGVVGARLLYADGTIQHSGVVLGAFALTHHLLQGRPGDFAGYHDRGRLTHAVSSVTAACAVVTRALFEAIGGFDEALPAAYNDVDLCLAARARGRFNVVVNRPLVHHFESQSRGYHYTPQQEAAEREALAYLLRKWGEGIRDDPHYNPNLAVDRENYTLAYPPRVPRERALRFPVTR